MIPSLEKQIIAEKMGSWMDKYEEDGVAIYEPACFSYVVFRIERGADYVYLVVNKKYRNDIEIVHQSKILAFISNGRPVFMTQSITDVIDRLERHEGEPALKVWFFDSVWP